MTKQEALEYWSCLSEAELIIRLGLYYDRVAELEAQVVQLNAGVSEMENELEQDTAEQWMQLIANEEHIQENKTVLIENQGQWVGIKRGDVVFGVWLDQLGCAVFRKVQP